MPVLDSPNRVAAFTKHIDHDGQEGGIGRIGVQRPFKITHAPGASIMPSMIGYWLKVFYCVVRSEKGDTSRLAVFECRSESATQVLFGGHIVNRIMNKDGVELTGQPDRAHITLDMFTLRIQFPADLKHTGRKVYQCHLEMFLQMGGVIPSPGSQLQHRDWFGTARRENGMSVELCLFGIILGSREYGPPTGDIRYSLGRSSVIFIVHLIERVALRRRYEISLCVRRPRNQLMAAR